MQTKSLKMNLIRLLILTGLLYLLAAFTIENSSYSTKDNSAGKNATYEVLPLGNCLISVVAEEAK
jgi:hypothetical protein